MKNFIAALTIALIFTAYTAPAFAEEPQADFSDLTTEEVVMGCAMTLFVVLTEYVDEPNITAVEAFGFYVQVIAERYDITLEQAVEALVEGAKELDRENPLPMMIFAGACVEQYEEITKPRGISV